MMMAHESSPTPPQPLAEETIALVRDELARYVTGRRNGDDLSEVLRRVAREAREKRVLAEQILIALKDVWHGLPEVQRMTDPNEQSRLLQRVVTICIREYYEE